MSCVYVSSPYKEKYLYRVLYHLTSLQFFHYSADSFIIINPIELIKFYKVVILFRPPTYTTNLLSPVGKGNLPPGDHDDINGYFIPCMAELTLGSVYGDPLSKSSYLVLTETAQIYYPPKLARYV